MSSRPPVKSRIDGQDVALVAAAVCIDAGCFLIAIPFGLIVLGVLIVAGVFLTATGWQPTPKDGN